MAKGQNIGFLNFGIDGDDTEMKKKLKSIRDDVISIEKVFKNIKIDTGASKLSTDVQKAQIQADKLGISNEKLVKSIHNTQKAEEQLTNERKRGAVLEQQRAKETARAALEVARQGEVELNVLHKKAKAQQQAEISAARLEGINKRNALIGVKGQQDFKKSVDDANKSLNNQGGLLTGIEKKIIGAFSTYQLARFAKEIITVRGEFQGLELGFETMLGSADKSRKMMADITDMALKTPYSVKEVADNTKQLIAMGIEADKAIDTMKALADVSSGLAVPMWRIAINYGQVQTLGRLQQREIRDFAMAGVPIVEELAKQLGKTKSEITEMVSAGKIGFPMVEKAFMSMAGEGGKFHNMTEKLNSTMLGQMNRLTDQIQLMFNAIGKSNEGIIYSAIGAASTLVENYEKVGKILMSLAAVYGTYKAILMAVNTLRANEVVLTRAATIANIELSSSQRLATLATHKFTLAQRALKSTMLTNPYVLVTMAIVGLVGAIWTLHDSTTAQEKAQKRLNELTEEASKRKAELEGNISSLISTINSETKTIYDQIIAYKELQGLLPEVFKNIDMQKFKSMNTSEQQRLISEAMNNIDADNLESQIKKYESAISSLKENYRSATVEGQNFTQEVDKMTGFDNFFRLHSIDQVEEALNSVLKGLEKQREEQKRIAEEAEFLAKPEKERERILNEQLVDLEYQRKTIEEQQSSLIDLYGEWAEFQPLFKILNGQQESILKQMEETKGKLKTNPDVKNQSYWKKQESDAKSALEAMTEAEKGSVEWNRQLRLMTEAQQKLKIWDFSGKQKRDFKDPLVTKLEKRIEIFKKAKVEFDKLSKTMDADSAFAKLNENPAFKGISKDELSADGFISSIDKMIAEVSKLKVSDERDKLLANLFTLKEDTISKLAKEAFDAIERELSKYKDKYNLYETLLGITGNEEQAQKLVFGNADEVVKSYRDKLKEAISKTEDKDFKKKLEDDLFSLEVNESSEFLKNIGKLLGKYQTIEDKIAKIKLDGVRERQKISDNEAKGELDSDLASKAINASINKQKELIAELENESLKLTPFYQKLFGDIGSYGNRMLDSLIDKTKEIIGEANKTGKNSSGLYEIKIDGESVSLTESDLARLIKQLGVLEGKVNSSNPFKRLAESIKEYNKSTKEVDGEIVDKDATDKAEDFSKLGESMMAAGDAVRGLSSDLAGMFDALGNEDMADAIGLIGELGDSLSEVAGGIMSGNYIQAASGIIKSLTSIFNFHDKKLDKAIKRSQLEVSKLKNSYSELSRFISRQLGAVAKQQAQEQIDNLKKQQKELRRQQAAEEDKKKKDKQAIEDYKNSISELEDQIRYFYEDLFSEQYKFDFKSIADQLSSALVDAFKNGEDAAVAFDKTVADIINNLATQMITLQVIEPAMKNLRDYLFGNNGVFLDGELSVSDAQGLVQYLSGLKDSIGKSKDIWDALNEAAEQAGIDLSSSDATDKGTLSKGIKEITEDTANLLASYINAIRADVSFNKEQLSILVTLSQLNNTTLGQMLSELIAIRQNTLNTANNTEAIANIVTETNNIIKQVTTTGSGRKINI